MLRSRQVAASEGASYRVSNRAPWSPAQIVVAVVGLIFIVIGGAALARAGVHFDAVPLSRTEIAGLWFTNMSALITLVAGVIMLLGAIDPDAAKATMWFFGVLLIAFGLIVAISPQPFATMWGYGTANGVFYIIAGAVLLLAGAVSPVYYSRHYVRSERQVVEDDVVPAVLAQTPAPVARTVSYEDGARTTSGI